MASAAASAAGKKKGNWLPLEADPELMGRYLHKLGADPEHKFAFHDVYGTDPDLLAMVPSPVLAVLLLFPISDASEAHKEAEATRLAAPDAQKVSPNLYYMKQTVGNACGTVGLTHVALNLADKLKLANESFFASFLASTKSMSPDERAQALDDDEVIGDEHESIASAGITDAAEAVNTNLHFIAFVACDGCLYELDGRKTGPVNHGSTTAETLMQDTAKVVQGFMQRDPESMQYNMVALAAAAE